MAEEPDIGWIGFVFGTLPEVKAVGEGGVVLGLDEAADDDDKGKAALAEVLALGA